MHHKYRVEIMDTEGEVKETATYKTKNQIRHTYNIPLYIIDKIIKNTNDSTGTTKTHLVYRNLMQTMRIHLNTPQLF